MAKQTQISKPEENLEEVESPNFVKFENIGDFVQGTLLSKGHSDQYNFGLFGVEQDDGSQVRFHGSAQLDDLMLAVKVGEWFKAVYVDNQKMPKGSMKLFRVYRKKA